jgi:hypothetical protein
VPLFAEVGRRGIAPVAASDNRYFQNSGPV